MLLTLEHRWEHALIAAIVESASKHSPGNYLGRTAIQKLLYFMNVLGVPMKYTFDIHHFGPFCPRVRDDVEWLVADGVIEDRASKPQYSNYRPGKAWAALTERFQPKLNEHRDKVDSVCQALSDLSPGTLELIATLDFSYRWVRARGGNGPWNEAAVLKFKEIKKEKFSDDEIDRWYGVLVKAGLIEP